MKSQKIAMLLLLALALEACTPGRGRTAHAICHPHSGGPVHGGGGRGEAATDPGFAQLALNSSGLVSEVLLKEGRLGPGGPGHCPSRKQPGSRLSETAQADALKTFGLLRTKLSSDAQYDLPDIFSVPSYFAGMTPTEAVEFYDSAVALNDARDAFEPYKYLDEKQLKLTDAEKDNPVLTRARQNASRKSSTDAWERYRRAVLWLEKDFTLANAKSELAQAKADYRQPPRRLFSRRTRRESALRWPARNCARLSPARSPISTSRSASLQPPARPS